MEYQYVSTTRSGHVQRGTMKAPSADVVRKHLERQQLLPISINEKKSDRYNLMHSVGRAASFSISLLDRVIFTRHLSIMLRSGLSLTEALDVLRDQAQAKKMKVIVQAVRDDVANGKTLAASMEKYPKVFSGLVVGMVRVGEASGTLERNLDYVATQLEQDYELRRKVKSAMIYPVIVLSATAGLGSVLSVFILPKLVRLFDSFRMELPFLTRMFMNFANFLVDYGWYVFGGALVIAAGITFFSRTEFSKPLLHGLALKLPILGRLTMNLNLARLTRALGILLKSGVPITESITITTRVINNVHYKRQLQEAAAVLQQGRSLASALSNTKYIPLMASKMIGVGEKSGKLEESLSYLANFYEEDVNNVTKNLSTALEPILLVVIGVVLGFLAVAIISPIYQFT